MGNTFSFNCGECQCRIKTSFQRLEVIIIWEDIPITTSSNKTLRHHLMQTHQSCRFGWVPFARSCKISGRKFPLPIAAALLCPQDCRIRNVPSLVDVTRMGQILSALVKWSNIAIFFTSMPMLSDNRRLTNWLVSCGRVFCNCPLARLELPVYHSQVVVRLSQTG